MLTELAEGFFANPRLVAVVRTAGNGSAVFTAGQSAIDGGHLVDYPANEVALALNDAEEEEDEESDEEDKED